jgi:hypothetical protein
MDFPLDKDRAWTNSLHSSHKLYTLRLDVSQFTNFNLSIIPLVATHHYFLSTKWILMPLWCHKLQHHVCFFSCKTLIQMKESNGFQRIPRHIWWLPNSLTKKSSNARPHNYLPKSILNPWGWCWLQMLQTVSSIHWESTNVRHTIRLLAVTGHCWNLCG